MSSTITVLRSRFVAPIDQPLIEDGAVVISGKTIVRVGRAKDILAPYRDAEILDLGSSLLLPGLVNAHAHLELSNCSAGDDPGGSFTDWILSVRTRMKLNESNPAETIVPATRAGIAQCLRFGVTCIGDISNFIGLTRPLLRESPLRAVSYGEVLGLAKLRSKMEEKLIAAKNPQFASERLTVGVTPHAPYTVDLDGYRACLTAAKAGGLPLATHLAETPDEAEFLTRHTGPFREVWDRLELWQEPVPTYQDSPVRFADAIGLLDYPTLLAHVNYCSDAELDLLANGKASVVYCPRTHRYFGHQPHRWREMLERGINVAIGTDSCASSPDLNLLDDLRLLHEIAPDFPCESLWQMATLHGARALGLDRSIGTIAPGKSADLVAFHALGDQPLREILETKIGPEHVWIEGKLIAKDQLPG
jgi:cytosine/adenosine deaminase-related metal-dependent hydrolase